MRTAGQMGAAGLGAGPAAVSDQSARALRKSRWDAGLGPATAVKTVAPPAAETSTIGGAGAGLAASLRKRNRGGFTDGGAAMVLVVVITTVCMILRSRS